MKKERLKRERASDDLAPKDRLCVALDVDGAAIALKYARQLRESVGMFKIGMELFTAEGPDVVRAVVDLGVKVFLDLKFHDIPNTVAGAARAAARLGVAMFNVHAAGGTKMIKAALQAASEEAAELGKPRPLVLGVTVLTSIGESTLNEELRIRGSVENAVRHFAEVSRRARADGVVASAQEVPIIRRSCGSEFLIVTPGIRPTWAVTGDQKRVVSPRTALELGADYIVVGRPILSSDAPVLASNRIIEEMAAEAQT